MRSPTASGSSSRKMCMCCLGFPRTPFSAPIEHDAPGPGRPPLPCCRACRDHHRDGASDHQAHRPAPPRDQGLCRPQSQRHLTHQPQQPEWIRGAAGQLHPSAEARPVVPKSFAEVGATGTVHTAHREQSSASASMITTPAILQSSGDSVVVSWSGITDVSTSSADWIGVFLAAGLVR